MEKEEEEEGCGGVPFVTHTVDHRSQGPRRLAVRSGVTPGVGGGWGGVGGTFYEGSGNCTLYQS